MSHKHLVRKWLLLAVVAACAGPVGADTTTNTQNIKEDFTGASTINTWLSFNGACLTAGSGTDQSHLPGCLLDNYYNSQVQYGGANGFLGTASGGTKPASSAGQTADPTGSGALRLTNGTNLSYDFMNGYKQNGAILSNFNFPSSNGIQITFKTVTYGGNSGGNGGSGSVSSNDGADGISFFLLDDSIVSKSWNTPLDSGAFGGSLGYTCSNSNNDPTVRSDGSVRGYDGMIGAYLGLGVDEYGNFLNPSDNTASGPGLQGNRIGLRGAGNISWKWLNATYPTLYPSTWSASNQASAVQNVCKKGYLTDASGNYYSSTTSTSNTTSSKGSNSIAVPDYAMITDASGNGAYKVFSTSLLLIANESATQRSQVKPITYSLKITQDGKLTFNYSYNGGTWTPVITSTPITGSNGPIPANVRFGFAGSDGGASNIHEILCFAAQPVETSGSSGGVNVYQNPTIRSGTQIFLANYFPSNWTGQLTAQTISYDPTTKTVIANTTPNWDARCVLTGNDATTGKCNTTGQVMTSAQDTVGSDAGARQLLTWDSVGKQGVPLEQPTSGTGITSAMVSTITAGDATVTPDRVNFLRGARTNEIPNGAKEFRTRQSVLGDIVDSSPTWVGPPQIYPSDAWTDQINTGATMPENSGQKYSAYVSKYAARPNVVYVGANDGFLHGFRAGSLDKNGNLDTSSGAVPNDGSELIGYMPGVVFQAIHNTTSSEIDYAGAGYSHAWYVDATPGTGDLFYQSTAPAPNSDNTQATWHTWIVGGLGPGGAAIYALDVTDPASYNEGTAATTVIGEWTPSNITCVKTTTNSTTACGPYMGNTYGTPLIRRFHNGSWGVIWGNGYGSSQGKSGIFIMLVDPSSAAKTFYYLPTNSSATGNGIGPTTSSDIDLDHVTDYIYAGDLKGNLWRFDVTNKDPTQWAVSANSPLFTTPTGQPITTAVTVSSRRTITTRFSLTGHVTDNSPVRMIINFGTGQQIPQTTTSSAQFASATQALYGVWDWDLAAWNTISPGQQAIVPGSGVSAPKPITTSNLVQQTMTQGSSGGFTYRTVSQNAVCWPNSNAPVAPNNPANPKSCKSANNFGWYLNLTSSNSLYEQAIFDSSLSPDGVFIVNTYIPASTSPLNCSPGTPTGFSMALEPDSGNPTPTGGYFFLPGGAQADGLQLNGIGMPSFIHDGVSSDANSEYMLTQSGNGLATPTKVATNGVVAGQRLNWIQRR